MEIKKGKRYVLKPSETFGGADGVFEVLETDLKPEEVKEEFFLKQYNDYIELYREYLPERGEDINLWVKYRDVEEGLIYYIPKLTFEAILDECLVKEL